jgi:phycocyanobilin lyase subunit beta
MTSTSIQALLAAVDAADSASRLLTAVEALAAAKLPETVPHLIAALGYNNPGAAIAAVDGLIQIGEPAVLPLLELIDGYNYGARAWALRALAGIGDPRALKILVDAAQHDFALSVRRAAACGLGSLKWEQMASAQIKPSQQLAFAALIQTLTDHEWIVRYAAIVGLQAIAITVAVTDTDMAIDILEALDRSVATESTPTVIARIWLAQKEIQQHAIDLLAQQPNNPATALIDREFDWHATINKLYARKQQERPIPEGDPRRFLPTAIGISHPNR